MPDTTMSWGYSGDPCPYKVHVLVRRQSTGNKVTAKIIIMTAMLQAKAFNCWEGVGYFSKHDRKGEGEGRAT